MTDNVTNEMDYLLLDFIAKNTSNNREYLVSMLKELHLDIHTKQIHVKRTQNIVKKPKVSAAASTLNIYQFSSLSDKTQPKYVMIYSHGGTIRKNTSLHSILFPAIVCLLSRLGIGGYFFTIDHRGSHSDIEKKYFNLEDRVQDLIHTYKFINQQFPQSHTLPHVLIGNSIGGHVACMATQCIDIQKLILLAPAAYSSEAHIINFGKGLTHSLHETRNFLQSPAFVALKKYLQHNGSCLLHKSLEDDVIPQQVTYHYQKILSNFPKQTRIYSSKDTKHYSISAADLLDIMSYL